MTITKESHKKESLAERKCAHTGAIKAKSEMIRFVVSPENRVVADIKANLPGRGVWLTAGRSIIKEAVGKKIFHRGFAKDLIVDPEIDQQIATLLEQAALGRLKLANKAGLAIYGFEKLMSALEKKTIIALFHATEASQATSDKLDYKYRTNLEQSGIMDQEVLKKPCNCFKTEELSLAFGQANVIHAGLKFGGASTAMITATEKLVNYQSG